MTFKSENFTAVSGTHSPGAEIVRELREHMSVLIRAHYMGLIDAADFIENIGQTKGASGLTSASAAAERNPTSDGGLAAGPQRLRALLIVSSLPRLADVDP